MTGARHDERAFYAALREAAGEGRQPTRSKLEDAGDRLGISGKRADYLLSKWTGRGWWGYGVSLRGGWFEPGAPKSLD